MQETFTVQTVQIHLPQQEAVMPSGMFTEIFRRSLPHPELRRRLREVKVGRDMLHLTKTNFKIEITQGNRPVLVMFYARWCPKCAMAKPLAEEMEEKYRRKIKFCEVDIEESPTLTEEYAIDIIPTFVLFRDGKIIRVMQGTIDERFIGDRGG